MPFYHLKELSEYTIRAFQTSDQDSIQLSKILNIRPTLKITYLLIRTFIQLKMIKIENNLLNDSSPYKFHLICYTNDM